MSASRKIASQKVRRGYTLVELLIVLLVAVLLVATALPMAATVLDDARVREASRTLNGYLAMAKSRAAGSGRPCGVLLVPTPITGSTEYQVTQLYLAEVAPPYGGSSLDPMSTAYVDGSWVLYFGPTTAVGDMEVAMLQSLINDGELFMIRFDFKGDWFVAERSGTDFRVVKSTLGTSSPPTVGKPFQIMRLPQVVGSPLELPEGTAIDLAFSGVGQTGTEFAAASSRLLVMFQPGGAVDNVFLNASGPVRPQGTLHFLVGRIEKTGAFDGNSNLIDPTSLWVSIGTQTGVVVTSENTPGQVVSAVGPFSTADISGARSIATNREQMGGR